MCFVWISEQTAIISLYSTNWLVFITETECVYCAVRAESLSITEVNIPLYRVKVQNMPTNKMRNPTKISIRKFIYLKAPIAGINILRYLLRIMPLCSGIATRRHVTGGRSTPPPSGRHEGHMRIGLVSRYCPVGRNVIKKVHEPCQTETGIRSQLATYTKFTTSL
jgi:hypothetical protein